MRSAGCCRRYVVSDESLRARVSYSSHSVRSSARRWAKRQVEVDAFDTVFADPDPLEERLVVCAAKLIGGLRVCLEAARDKPERLLEVVFDLVESQSA